MAQAECISKAEFARRRGVSAGRVSQWISEKKIGADALVGDGRNARIREAVAIEQLRSRLDVMQMTANGIGTNLALPVDQIGLVSTKATIAPIAEVESAAALEPIDTIEEKIKQARLEQIERQNREGRRQEALDAGRLTDAGVAKAAAAREISKIVNAFEGSLSDFATAISAEFKLPQRDVLHLLRSKFRDVRQGLADAARSRIGELPVKMPIELGDADES